jgi:SAM-dependent methyltransferase
MSDIERGQVSAAAAEVYETLFVPALFASWTDIVLDTAAVGRGLRVLDVGCGTGVLARAAHARVGELGSVTAVDPNDGMLHVARRIEPAVRWDAGDGRQLPYADASFDRTVSQFALMFFPDPVAGVTEMARVTTPAGRVTFAVWDGLERNPGYAWLADTIEELFGVEAAGSIRVPYQLGDPDLVRKIARTPLAGLSVTRQGGVARFPSLDAWLRTEIKGWTLADAVDDDGIDALVQRARRELVEVATEDGVALPVSALVATGTPA